MTRDGEGLGTAWRLARRELRGGLKGFRVFLACLALGVAAIAGVGSVTEGMLAGLAEGGQTLLGGDIDVSLRQRRAEAAERQWLASRAARLSETAELRAMARPLSGTSAPALVELKAVDANYPLYGTVALDPPQALGRALAASESRFGAVAEESLLTRLGLSIGDTLSAGDATFVVNGIIREEPDRASSGLLLAPRLLIGLDALQSTGLIVPGSLISFHYRLALPANQRAMPRSKSSRATLDEAWPRSLFRVTDRNGAAPGLRRFLHQANLFFTLVALTALAVGGVGVGNAVKGYLDGKRTVIATLKCLGASGGFIMRDVSPAGHDARSACDCDRCSARAPSFRALPAKSWALSCRSRRALRFIRNARARGGLRGAHRACFFLVAARARTRNSGGLSLPRSRGAGAAVAAAALYCLRARLHFVARSSRRGLCALSGLCAVVPCRGGGELCRAPYCSAVFLRLAKQIPRPRRPALRLALANLVRPGTPAPSIVLSLGLGLTLLVAVALIDGNIRTEIARALPARAPAFFFVDIQRAELRGLHRAAR